LIAGVDSFSLLELLHELVLVVPPLVAVFHHTHQRLNLWGW
jgi:hypothetical protein